MKLSRVLFIMLLGGVVGVGLGGVAYAFHAGGAAECGGCHSMHSPYPGGVKLLVERDPSSVCLTCHEVAGSTGPSSYRISTATADQPAGVPPLQLTPGGDFGWIKKTYSYVLRGNTITELGERHGHNIISGAKGYVQDSVNLTSPGGSMDSSMLSCVSCHNPHGSYRRLNDETIVQPGSAPVVPTVRASGSYNNSPTPAVGEAVGVYRLLHGNGYLPDGNPTAYTGVPAAVAPSTYNRTEATTQTRVAYGDVSATSGNETWGNWCATCHGDMHSSGSYVHEIDFPLPVLIANIYNQYRGSGRLDGLSVDAYLSLVPFIEGNVTYATLKTHALNNNSYLNGPVADVDQVSCMSCHRAHASGWSHGLRWNMEGELIIVAGCWPGTDATCTEAQDVKWSQGRTYAESKQAMYNYAETKFVPYQRVLCNKCHAKD